MATGPTRIPWDRALQPHLVTRAERRSMSLKALGPERMMTGTNATDRFSPRHASATR
jgi:hypothetical protein